LATATAVNLFATDQTTSDSTNVSHFENVDASALGSAVSLTGSAGANLITGGIGADTIDGNGGADTIHAGDGNDTVTYHSTETLIDGGNGSNTLVMTATATVDLSNGSDQTTAGDSTTVTDFTNVNASGLSSGASITGSSGANTITGGTGADTIDGNGGADVISAGNGNDTVIYHGTETSIDGGGGTDTLKLATAATIDLSNSSDQTSGGGVVTNFDDVDASGVASGVSITGSSSANTIIGGIGDDTIAGGGGVDHLFGGGGNDTFIIDDSSLTMGAKIDGGTGSNSLNFAANSGTVHDAELVASLTNVQSIDFTASGVDAALSLTGAMIAQMDGGASNTLTMKINAGDSITIAEPLANYDQAPAGNTTNYTIYDDASHTNVIAHLALVA
jgi:Ca2+-binding RTX toxin-like protein